MKVYKWNVPTTNYPVFPNITPKKKDYKYIYTLLIILIVFILLYYNGSYII